MFIQNKTGELLSLSRGHLCDGVAVGVVIVESAFAVGSGGLVRVPTKSPRPATAGKVLWHGSSVTVTGTVYDTKREGCVTATVVVGQELRRLHVFGDRWWRRRRGQLVPSDAKAFDQLPLSFRLAYGGTVSHGPGPDPSTGLPQPGARPAWIRTRR